MTGGELEGDIGDLVPIRATVDCPAGGRLVTLGAPGLSIGHRGDAWLDPEGVERAIDALVRRDASLFLFLARDEDCPAGLRLLLRQRVRQAGIAFAALPIDDFAAPGRAWIRAWRRLEGYVSATLAQDRTIALCCSYGAGRSGTVAAYILNERGLSVKEALFRIRDQFPESVESPLQETWLHEQFNDRKRAVETNGGPKT
ncbi:MULTISPECIES: dual specificity protein phosphatase family protein [unclassified Ensifer]|uniref:protein-tyrosine phosphatase family protein n=1 Tax=unclassified Ensifer TaxID=2633371 RepID=UPI00081357B9|nr:MULTISPECIES: dual specificity protein phosphatase family protein [unclassified Ensifer]OCP00624.1 hypothetical protein BC362_03080 [Ensifer sp. LC14]OCP07823.1 hypothetical protein BBX50_20975 [Ensifer sp. LC11]OCP08590.1 hypothetical protein BC374_21185 [Ensifer sp. LC13]OCP32118.1 hypothetical protein BC364_20505 [Ensifer sp. LC499]